MILLKDMKIPKYRQEQKKPVEEGEGPKDPKFVYDRGYEIS